METNHYEKEAKRLASRVAKLEVENQKLSAECDHLRQRIFEDKLRLDGTHSIAQGIHADQMIRRGYVRNMGSAIGQIMETQMKREVDATVKLAQEGETDDK